MKINVSERAHEWFVEEMGLEKGDAVRFSGKIYGATEVHDNFSIAISISHPNDPLAIDEVDGISYFVEESDDWFFNGYDLEVDYNEKLHEADYHFIKQ